MAQSDHMGKRQAGKKPGQEPEERGTFNFENDAEAERLAERSTSDEDVGQDRLDRKGIDAPADDLDERTLHAKPLSDNGRRDPEE